jgi:hypothetical protein
MPGDPVRLGPFTGGINTLSDLTALADTELADCINYELDLDGSLVSRPPAVVHAAGIGTSKMRHLGFAMIGGTIYHIASNSAKTSRSVDGVVWTDITTTFGASAMVQYGNKAWLVNSAGAGGSWEPTGGFAAVATMPAGDAAVILKERMYIVPGANATVNASRLRWSTVTDPSIWNPVTDFADVGSGDGQNLVDIAVLNDNLVLFKNDSTYSFAFDSGPSGGILRKISGTIGATRRDCVALYEQSLYVYHEGNVYEIVNFDFARLNTKVPFLYDPTAPSSFTDEVFICVFGDRLLVRYYNRLYVFGFRTRTWTRWTSSLYFGVLRGAPINTTAAVNPQYYAGACVSGDNRIFRIDDGFGSLAEAMTCSIQTKNYDLSISYQFKRLFWWGVDISSSTSVDGIVTPIVFKFAVTWAALSTHTWNSLTTWDQPLTAAPGISDTVLIATGGVVRKFVKFLKSIRFRQVNFFVSTTITGTSVDGPVRLFSLVALIGQKQTVSKAVS